MASLLDGVQYLDHGRGIDNSSFNSPSPYTEQWSPAPDTPHSSLLSHCFIYSWLTCSRGSAPPFWGVEISSTGLYNFKWWHWLYGWKGGNWHRKVIRKNRWSVNSHSRTNMLVLSDLFSLFSNSWMEMVMWVKCPAQVCVTPPADAIFHKVHMSA